jgi:hypothetical protein
VSSVRLNSKGTVGTIMKWNSSSTDDVCNGDRRPINSWHTEVCHLLFDSYMCHVSRDPGVAHPATVPAVLADSLLHSLSLRDGRDLVRVGQYISESVQSCDASKQLLQGEKQQKFYARRNFIAFCALLLSNSYCFF